MNEINIYKVFYVTCNFEHNIYYNCFLFGGFAYTYRIQII